MKIKKPKSVIISERRDFRKKKIKRKKTPLGRDGQRCPLGLNGSNHIYHGYIIYPRLIDIPKLGVAHDKGLSP